MTIIKNTFTDSTWPAAPDVPCVSPAVRDCFSPLDTALAGTKASLSSSTSSKLSINNWAARRQMAIQNPTTGWHWRKESTQPKKTLTKALLDEMRMVSSRSKSPLKDVMTLPRSLNNRPSKIKLSDTANNSTALITDMKIIFNTWHLSSNYQLRLRNTTNSVIKTLPTWAYRETKLIKKSYYCANPPATSPFSFPTDWILSVTLSFGSRLCLLDLRPGGLFLPAVAPHFVSCNVVDY